MNWHYLYLFLDLAAISVPFAFSFYKRANFSKKWQYLLPAIVLPGILFIVWDVYFTKWGIWGFNPAYLTGLNIVNLPVEEWMFFICIPYACVFTYFAFGHLIEKDHLAKAQRPISWTLIIASLVIASLNTDKAYTATTFYSLALFLLLHIFVIKSNYLGRFYFAFIVILLPFFLINGVLTGSGIEDQVVWYNDNENLGIRMITIPVEDTFYGMLLLMMNVTVFEELQNRVKKA